MDSVVFTIAGLDITLLAVIVATVVIAGLAIGISAARRRARERVEQQAAASEQRAAAIAQQNDARLGEFARAQAELAGRMQTMAEVLGGRQADLARVMSERLDGFGHRLGQSMTETTKNTHESLSKLNERLAVIDRAQVNITQLSGQVVELQHILANKQSRGAFGQGRMEAIVQDGLPAGSYSFQATLSNGKRPDCLVNFPNGAPALVIDAKFPLEGWTAVNAQGGDKRATETQFKRDIATHINAIKQKYFVPGETQDTAFMFVPSESIFAGIHERFEDLVQFAHKNRVVIVSPSLLLLSIQVIQAVLRDARIKEQAHLVRDEVGRLMEDVGRLDERVRKLQQHFTMANRDIEDILISSRKVASRGEKIDQLDFGPDAAPAVARQPELRLAGE